MVKTPSQHLTIPPLENGDRLNRYEFERRYNAMLNLKKAELIEGIVYMPAALRFKSHSQPHSWMIGWLVTYEATTPGAAVGASPTVLLDLDNEPQPDAVLLINEEAGGIYCRNLSGELIALCQVIAGNAMTTTEFSTLLPELPKTLPDHTQLPESDGTFVKNFQEHPQSLLLTDSISPVLQQLHPDGQYCIGQDSGIYWRLSEPPEKGAEAPDWFYVPNVPPTLNGQLRRSYVMWQEIVAPLIVLEFVSGDGQEERDQTPYKGKFWVYERAIRVPFYGIYEVTKASVEVYHLIEDRYQLMPANERGHYPVPPLGVELGIWQGHYKYATLPWLRWWDGQGNLLLTGEERAAQEQLRAEQAESVAAQERLRAEQAESLAAQERLRAKQAESLAAQERLRAEQLAERLRAMGIDPDDVTG